MTEFVTNERVNILFDTVITAPIMENNICKGLVVENKTGCEYYGAKIVVDTTGDADVLLRMTRTIVTLPGMPQFRKIRHIDGDYTLKVEDAYRHFDDSVAAICDFERRDYLYEVPYRTMVKTGFPNLITAGCTAAADGYAWDVLRVIPPAILTGQAAGVASAMAIDTQSDICKISTMELQRILEEQKIMIHFDDRLVP